MSKGASADGERGERGDTATGGSKLVAREDQQHQGEERKRVEHDKLCEEHLGIWEEKKPKKPG